MTRKRVSAYARGRRKRSQSVARGSHSPTVRSKRSTDLASIEEQRIKKLLAVETYTAVKLTLDQFGLEPQEQTFAFNKARKLTAVPAVSGPLLKTTNGLAELLKDWSRDPAYLTAKGRPRVLTLFGSGVTFETLAKRHLPTLAAGEVLKIACKTAEVQLRNGGKIALTGSVVVNMVPNDLALFAHAVRALDQLLETILYNRRRNKKQTGNGRIERRVTGVIAREYCQSFMQKFRTHVYDLFAQMDAEMEAKSPKTQAELATATAISVGLVLSQEDDWTRAGIDTAALLRRLNEEQEQ